VEDRQVEKSKTEEVGKISLVNPIIPANLKRVDKAEVNAGIINHP
jgi:hypothetical protein